MKVVAFIFVFALLISCGTARKTNQMDKVQNENPELQQDIVDTERIVGTVRLNKECGTLIYAKIGETEIIIIPENLDEKYQKEGMKIKFFFKNSSLPIPWDCIASSRGRVEEVTPLR